MTDTWNTIADWYTELLRTGSSLHAFNRDIILDRLPDELSGQRVLDLGCGEGTIIPHPCFEAPRATWTEAEQGRPRRVVGDYLAEGFWRSANPQGVRRAGNQHRTLSTYLTALPTHDFQLEAVAEPPPGAEVAAEQPQRADLPPFLLVHASRRGGAPTRTPAGRS